MIEIRHNHIDTPDDEVKAYDKIYEDHGICQLDSFYMWLLSLLQARPGQTLLDVSSGEGRLGYLARQKGLRVYDFDFSPIAVKKECTSYPDSRAWICNAEAVSIADHSFDYVTNIGSLEHYFRPEAAIREMNRLLKPDGRGCILLPNAFGLFGNVKNVWQTGEVFDDGQPLQRYNTLRGWHQLLAQNGLQPYHVLKYERVWPRTREDYLWYLSRPLKTLRLFISPLVPLNLSNLLVYLCRPTYPLT